jgi:tetratricopeptide (TPR) repeat protein
MADPAKISVAGPYAKQGENSEWVAYVLEEPGGPPCRVCVVLDSREPKISEIVQGFAPLFEAALATARETFEHWDEASCLLVLLRPTDDPFRISSSVAIHDDKGETDVAVLAETALDSLIQVRTRAFGDNRYKLATDLVDPNSGVRIYRVEREGDEVGFHVITRDERQLDLIGDIQPELDRIHAQMYLQEILTFLKGDQPLFAFRSFYYFFLLADDATKRAAAQDVVDLGSILIECLFQENLFDYAEWVARTLADFAGTIQDYGAMVRVLRYAGMAVEGLGWIQEIQELYDRALSLLDKIDDIRLRAKVHMSYGISLVFHLGHWDSSEAAMEGDRSLATVCSLAERQLSTAYKILDAIVDEQAADSRCAITLDLIRVEDLRGNHESALQRLDEHLWSDHFVRTPRLITTAALYRCSILKKLAGKDTARSEGYLASLNQARALMPAMTPDRQCAFLVLYADALRSQGLLDPAIDALRLALDLQRTQLRSQVRPPRPHTAYGGWLAIDVSGKLQSALQSRGDPEALREAFRVSDKAKGRFFGRDVAYLIAGDTSGLSALQRSGDWSLRNALVRGAADQRIVMADYEWFLRRNAPAEAAERLEQILAEDPDLESTVDGVLADGPAPIILAFYTTDRTTFVYTIQGDQRPCVLHTLNLGVDRLRRIVSWFQTGIHGNALYPPIDPGRPERSEKFFAPFLALGELLTPVFETLSGSAPILISPHGLWHNLPLHALLLPYFWKVGVRPVASYIPSVRIFKLLQKRSAGRRIYRYRKFGLTTCPAVSDTPGEFAEAHGVIAEAMREGGRPIEEVFGDQATPEKFFSDIRNVGCHHVLAHGRYESRAPMSSGILLADHKGLPSRESGEDSRPKAGVLVPGSAVVTNGTTAGDFIVQACSIGQSQASQGDEIWGFVRALLAAGADSVVAPLWDIDLESSTRLLACFYHLWLHDGQPKATAWSNAQYQLYSGPEQERWAHFYHWAAFRMIGY